LGAAGAGGLDALGVAGALLFLPVGFALADGAALEEADAFGLADALWLAPGVACPLLPASAEGAVPEEVALG